MSTLTHHNLLKFIYRVIALVFLFFIGVFFAHAQGTSPNFVSIVGIPGITTGNNMSLPQYINALYYLTITVGALIGVIKIALAGVKYSLSDVVTDKASAKKDIYGVLLGLAILLIPFIVLQTIYPGLTNLNVLGKIERINTNVQTQTPVQSAVQQSRRVGDICAGNPHPACASVTDADRRSALACIGFYDYAVKKCFTQSSSQEYVLMGGSGVGSGNSTSLSVDGWDKLCGGSNNVVQVPSATNNNAFTLSCKK